MNNIQWQGLKKASPTEEKWSKNVKRNKTFRLNQQTCQSS